MTWVFGVINLDTLWWGFPLQIFILYSFLVLWHWLPQCKCLVLWHRLYTCTHTHTHTSACTQWFTHTHHMHTHILIFCQCHTHTSPSDTQKNIYYLTGKKEKKHRSTKHCHTKWPRQFPPEHKGKLTKSPNQPIIDPIHCSIPGSVRRVQSDASFQARSNDPLLPRGLSQALERSKDGRVVGHNHVHPLADRLQHDRGGQVVRQQQLADRVRGAGLQQQANVIPGTWGKQMILRLWIWQK